MPWRRLAIVVLAGGAAAVAAAARAEEATVILDRGRASKAASTLHEDIAARLVGALRERGARTRLLVYGSRPNGRLRAAELRGNPREGIEKARALEGWRFEGPTDPRVALELAVRRHGGVGAIDVFLVGAFGGTRAEDEEGAAGLAAWSRRAPEGSRVWPIGLATDRVALLSGAEGLVDRGAIVLDVGEIEVRPAPFSPLPPTEGPRPDLEADILVPVESVPVGRGTEAPLLDVVSRIERDRIEALAPRGGMQRVRLRRPPRLGRVATLRVRRAGGESVLWLAPPPGPRTFRWDALLPDARLEAHPAGGPPLPFEVSEAWVGEPHVVRYLLRRTRAGAAPTWTARAEEGDLPPGLEVDLSREVVRDEWTATRIVLVSFAARRGDALDARGVLVLEAAGHPAAFRIPYRVRVPSGRVRVRLVAAADPVPLPPSDHDPWWSLVVEATNPNAPDAVHLLGRTEPPEARAALRLVARERGGDQLWDPTVPFAVRTGTRYEMRPTLAPGRPGVDARFSLEPVSPPGVETEAAGAGRVRRRRPSLVVDPAPFAYRLRGDAQAVGAPPLTLRMEADGGTGEWLRALHGVTPQISLPPDAPLAWEVRAAGAGAWELVPAGRWRGARPETFVSRRDDLEIRVDWPRGPAPGVVVVGVEVPPRWGTGGWILLGLALLALALGGWGVWQMRPPPLEGTLLYTVEGREGAVGRLDLAPAGRRRVVVRPDRAGRLHVGGAGPRLFSVRPTRVGGMLVVPREGGGRERHLLVDGLTLTVGGRRLRYVSPHAEDATVGPAPAPAADLLGPEYDLPGGRIEALGGTEAPPAPGRDSPDPSAPPRRS